MESLATLKYMCMVMLTSRGDPAGTNDTFSATSCVLRSMIMMAKSRTCSAGFFAYPAKKRDLSRVFEQMSYELQCML